MSDLAAALMVAIRVHAGQMDKLGEPYLLHVLRVVEAVSDEAKVVAALHDVLEDGPSSLWEDLDNRALLGEAELGAVELLTRLDGVAGVAYAEYIENILRGPGYLEPVMRLAREVKLADLRDNLGRIPSPPIYDRAMPDHVRSTWEDEWGSLKARYEKAIAALSTPTAERVGRERG